MDEGETSLAPDLSIVTVLYNSSKIFSENLISWLDSGSDSYRIELIVVSNDQQPIALSDSATKMTDALQCFNLQLNDTNTGFAAAANQAIHSASSKWILLLNPDVKMSPNSLKQIVESCHRNLLSSAKVFSITLKTRNRLYNGIYLTWFGFLSDKKLARNNRSPIGPSGGAMLIDRDLYLSLRGFNEQFFMWAEDAEFALRLQRDGHNVQTLDLRLEHAGGHSLSSYVELRQKAFLLARNRLFAMRMNFSPLLCVVQLPSHVLAALARAFGTKVLNRTAIPYLRGLAVGLFGKLPEGSNMASRKLGLSWRFFKSKSSHSS